MIYCPSCGKSIPADSKFCTFCGALIPATEVSETVETKKVVPVETHPVKPVEDTSPVRPVEETLPVTPVEETRTVRRERVLRDGRPLYSPAGFISSPGFWGSILIMAGFFLTWFNDTAGTSGLQLVRTDYEQWKLVLLLFPISAFIVFIQSLTGALPAGLSGFFKFIPFLLLIAFAAVMVLGRTDESQPNKYGMDFHDIPRFFKWIGIGLWLTIIGSLLMLFHKKYIRIA